MRNRLLQTKEDLVDAAFEKALAKLKNFVETDEYHDYLLKTYTRCLLKESAKKTSLYK